MENQYQPYNDPRISFLYDNNNDGYKGTIHTLDLAQGLMQLLVENNSQYFQRKLSTVWIHSI